MRRSCPTASGAPVLRDRAPPPLQPRQLNAGQVAPLEPNSSQRGCQCVDRCPRPFRSAQRDDEAGRRNSTGAVPGASLDILRNQTATYLGAAAHMDRTQPRTVGILIFDDVEVLDFAGPLEVFASARPIDNGSGLERLFRPLILAEEQRMITCRGGLLV